MPQKSGSLVETLLATSLQVLQLIQGRKFGLIVIAEGVKNEAGEKEKSISDYLAQRIEAEIQRLCTTGEELFSELNETETPSSYDRLLAAAFGKKAVD